MFRRVLIANRGEVAARIARTCKKMGIEAVAVASAADRDAQWLADVDEVVAIGPARASASYLDVGAILTAAVTTGCSAVHPGWGFLAENAGFATRCEAIGLAFVGPSPTHLRQMGDKALARATMSGLGMPIIPGSKDPVATIEEARRVADEVGYPVLLKAVAGGGGKGMRRVDDPADLAEAFENATAEAQAAFGDGRMYLERRIVGGRHVEVQILGDGRGGCVHLHERECSLQRRHQKVLEESPSPGLSAKERARILPLVAEACGRARYRSAGTVEMLLDADGKLWFMEMNTRLQVEHPVTEVRFGVDLVECMLRVAANEPLPSIPEPSGHSIECRINAEDPDQDFRPSPGRVTALELPTGEGIRVDTHLRAGDRIPPDYDSMVAKVIAWAPDRPTAIARMEAALASTRVEGVTTNLGLQRKILGWEAFRTGRYDTTSLERELLAGGGLMPTT
jgi:acetyl-CoA carboxylase biotin carboxylase subunit